MTQSYVSANLISCNHENCHRFTEKQNLLICTHTPLEKTEKIKSRNEEKYEKPAEKPSLGTNAELNAFKSDLKLPPTAAIGEQVGPPLPVCFQPSATHGQHG